jgi:hypothetical protein
MKINTIIILALGIIAMMYMFGYFSKKEKFEDMSILDNIEIREECKDMTPSKLFGLFHKDLPYLTQVFVDNNIPQRAIQDASYYPAIASLLQQKDILKCV